MQRIDTPTRILNKHGPGKDGFGDGNPTTGAPSTQLNSTWFDHSQEEIANAIEMRGITLDPADMTQLWQAMSLVTANLIRDSGGVFRYAQSGSGGVLVYDPTGTHSWAFFAFPPGTAGAVAPTPPASVSISSDVVHIFGPENPLRVAAPGGSFSRVQFAHANVTSWLAGIDPGARFVISDAQSVSPDRFLINDTGLCHNVDQQWHAISDMTVKRNQMTYHVGLNELLQLTPVSFEYSDDIAWGNPGQRYYGLNAQEVQQIVPEAVSSLQVRQSDGTYREVLTVGNGPIPLAVVNALKEINNRQIALEGGGVPLPA